ncbi:MAG: hypothetical protein GX043_10660 [Desulfovibrionales bacterium]|nr:hypothetical protein [Desulfovibrionales bacterium]
MYKFLLFLRENMDQIKAAEAKALELLHGAGDEQGYRENMRLKAQILADLADNAQPFLDDVSSVHRPTIEHRLNMFAQSAQRSLDLDSVFYMSALLYPEDHEPGQPTTLELWIRDLERLQ